MYNTVGDETMARSATPIVGDAQSLLQRGVEALERERPQEAVTLLRLAAQLAPQSADTSLALGVAALRCLSIPEALRALEHAIELSPSSFFPHFRLAELYMRIGIVTKAREQFERAMDTSESAEQRQMVRQLMMIDAKRAEKRIWRPDFSLLGRKKGSER